MRAKLIVAAVAALAVAALGATQVPGKAPSKPPLNFTLNGKIKTISFVDDAPGGDSVGDVVVFTQTLPEPCAARWSGATTRPAPRACRRGTACAQAASS